MKVYGIEKQVDKERNVTYVPKVCPRCKEVNSSVSMYCFKCGMPLESKAMDNLVGNQRKIQDKLFEMGSITSQIQSLIDMMPESEKTGILSSVIELALKQRADNEEKK